MSNIDFTLVQDWGSGFEGQLSVTNDDYLLLEDWTLAFTADFEITSIWNAEIVSHEGDRYVIRYLDWDPDLSAGETINIGFNGIPASNGITAPTNYNLSGSNIGETGASPQLSVSDSSIVEGDDGQSYLTYTVNLDSASDEAVTVDFATADGTAIAGEDYVANSGTLAFAAGETSKTIQIAINGDDVTETDEAFSLNLSNASGATITDAQAIGTITNDDGGSTTPPSGTGNPLVGQTGQQDIFSFTWNWGSNDIIENFNPNEDIIDLESFWFSNSDEFTVTDNSNGDAVIAIPSNNQTITVQGVSSSDLTLGGNLLYQASSGGGGTLPPDSFELVGYDNQGDALQITLDQGMTTLVLNFEGSASDLSLATNNADLIQTSLNPLSDGSTEIVINTLDAGRGSLRIENSETGETRFVGIRVKNEDGTLPGSPDYVAVGSVSEDSQADLGFWQDFGDGLSNKRVDMRYLYLNGGATNNPFYPDPENPSNWRTWGEGNRIGSYLEESLKLGMVPYFVWYNIPDGGESYSTDLAHIQDRDYMQSYFEDLKFALDEIRTIAGDETVGMILEPDFLGYMAQNAGTSPQNIEAMTSAIYDAGVLDSAVDPVFDNSVTGLVQAINYTISKYAPNVDFGWQFNLWASPAGGFTEVGIPGKGVIHLTETLGFEAGKQAIVDEAAAIANYYMEAGVLSHGADFISIDKYGLDAAGASAGAAENPQDSTWFWNHDLWKNYLLFVQTLHETTDKSVTLWQIPVGHINGTEAENPYSPSNEFTDLNNTATQYEDSAGTFFLGDTFVVDDPERLAYFSQNQWQDAGVVVDGNRITWAPNMDDVEAAGIDTVLFGAGVGISTDGVGEPPTDGYWWISQVQEYYESLEDSTVPSLPTLSINNASVVEGDDGSTDLGFSVTLSAASDQEITVDYSTADGSAIAGEDYDAVSGTLTFAPGEITQTLNVSVTGDTQVEGNESFSLNLSNANGVTISDAQGIGTITDNDQATVEIPEISISDASSNEGNEGITNQTFTVNLSSASDQTVTIDYATVDGSATAGEDYLTNSGTLTFAPGETSQTIDIAVNGDSAVEADEDFGITLSNAVGGTLFDAEGVGTIVNDDQNPITPSNSDIQISFQVDSQWSTGFSGTITLTNIGNNVIDGWTLAFDSVFDITSVWNAEQIDVNGDRYEISDLGWNAQIAANGSVSFGFNGDWEGGAVPEPSNYEFNGELLGNFPGLSLNDVSITEGDEGVTTALFTVGLNAASDQSVTVDYATAEGTAIAGEDFISTQGTLTFAPGETSQTVEVSVIGDSVYEGNEQFTLNLSNATEANIRDAQGVASILENDPAPPSLSIDNISVSEGNEGSSTATLTVTLDGTSDQIVHRRLQQSKWISAGRHGLSR